MAGEGRSRTLLSGGLALAVLLVVGIGAYLLFGDDASSVSDVPKIAARLLETDMRSSPDRQSGLRPLISVLAEPTEYDALAVGRDGTLALAVRQMGEVRVLRFSDGTQSANLLEGAEAVTALGVDPEGTIYVGLRRGGYAHITPDGVVHQDATLVEGFSIVGFAFDAASRRSAVMLSGGEVRTGMRPLTRDGLHTVTMPDRARIREMTYDGEGDLWVAGDAGAVFVSTEDGWEERNLMTPGRVTAFGTGPGGDVVAGQAGGQIYRESGGGWTLLGQIGATPIAAGSDAEGAVVVAGADGSLHREADSAADFVELPGYAAPDGDHAAHGAVVLGPIAAFVTPERVWVWDEVLWDSASEEVQRPVGAEGRVVPLGPWSARVWESPPTYFVLDDDDATLRRFEGAGLTAVSELAYREATVSAGSFRTAVRAAVPGRRMWLNDAHHAMDDFGISRWDGAGGYTMLARFAEDSGRLVGASARQTSDGPEIVAITDSGAIHRARLSDEEPAFVEKVPHARFQEHYGDDFYPASASVVSVGPSRLLVIHDAQRITRVDLESDEVEPVDLGDSGQVHGAVALPAGALVAIGDSLVEVGEDFSATPWDLPEGVIARFSSRRGHLLFALRGDDVLIGGDNQGRTFAFRCRQRRCGRLPLPAGTVPAALFFAGDTDALVWSDDGVLAVLPLGGGLSG